MIADCTDDLGGTWRGESGTWLVVDVRDTLEAYPIFHDLPATEASIVVAPRLIDLHRASKTMGGEVHRRYMQGATACDARAQVHVLSCSGDRLELVLADPQVPITFRPCAWAGNPPSRREVWVR